jgi:hypothetical protein
MAVGNTCRSFGIFYDHLLHFVFIWYIFTVMVSCNMKNLATLVSATGWNRNSNAFYQDEYVVAHYLSAF